jgi:hypothetical protein
MAKKSGVFVRFTFNDVLINAESDATMDNLVVQYFLGLEAAAALSAGVAGDGRTFVEAELIIKKTTLKFSDESVWRKTVEANKDDVRGMEAIRIAERWAKLMQHQMEVDGKTLDEVAEKSWPLAIAGSTCPEDRWGIHASLLCVCWIHGKELRKWCEKKTTTPAWKKAVGQVTRYIKHSTAARAVNFAARPICQVLRRIRKCRQRKNDLAAS